MIVRYIDSPPVVTATGGGTTGMETDADAAVDTVAVDAVEPEFETVEAVWDVVE